MSIKDKYFVQPVTKADYAGWILKKHYAHRMPMAVEYAFGLYDENKTIVGVCIFGPTAPPVPITLFGEIGKYVVRELTRLVVNEGVPSNTLSYFVSQCMKIIPISMCLVSYADENAGHHGYIYQALNWIYTGKGGGETNIIDNDGKPVHNITITDGCKREKINRAMYMQKYEYTETKALPKHRYLYFLGNKVRKKEMMNNLKCSVLPYPKGDNKRYDASYEPEVQNLLF